MTQPPTATLDRDRPPTSTVDRRALVDALVDALVQVEGGDATCLVDLRCVSRKCLVDG